MKDLLLLHGALGSGAQLAPLRQALSPYFTTHVLTFPGHGGTALPDAFSIPAFAGHVQQYCETNGLRRVQVFGYSMGGYVALQLARACPQLVERVATLATKFHWDEATAARETALLQPEAMEAKVPQLVKTLEQRHAPQNWKTVVQRTAALLTALGKDNLLKNEDYRALPLPVLVMLGDRDKMVGREETIAVFEALPAAELCLLPATRHPLEMVDTALLGFLLKRFFEK